VQQTSWQRDETRGVGRSVFLFFLSSFIAFNLFKVPVLNIVTRKSHARVRKVVPINQNQSGHRQRRQGKGWPYTPVYLSSLRLCVCATSDRGCDVEGEARAREDTSGTASARDAIMRTKALINHFHDLQPIYSAHFEPGAKRRLATAGGDNNVRACPLFPPSFPCPHALPRLSAFSRATPFSSLHMNTHIHCV
jgi:hypothetical protein